MLSVLQDQGYRVALVTDGRMSGASGKVPAAIHVSPEAKDGGPLSRIQTDDVIRLDASTGQLMVLIDKTTLNARQPAPVSEPQHPAPWGRSLFSTLRHQAGPATEGGGLQFFWRGLMHPVLQEALSRSPVMPVLVIPEISMAAPLAEALASGGLTVFEITLRTECALDAMVVMRDAVPEALIGAGTVTNVDRMRQANDCGADFVVSPGTTQMLWNASIEYQLPMLPGFSSASEAMVLKELGSHCGKFFPAETSGGVNYLKSLAGPLPDFSGVSNRRNQSGDGGSLSCVS